MSSADGRLALDWAHAIVSAIAAAGTRHAVVSPGSRSTPLVLALRHAPLQLHVIIDERAAGFFALAMARELEEPVALVCTSGSAGGHYLPAVMEAAHTGVPLLVVTADRPFRLMDSGANQTTDQSRLYGSFARFVDLGDPQPSGLAAAGARIARVLGAGEAGPIHINARFDKPLQPDDDAPPAPIVARPIVHREQTSPAIADLVERLRASERPVMVAGPLGVSARRAREAVDALAATGVVVLAEACSQFRFGTTAASIGTGLSWVRAPEPPDLVLQVGAAPVTPDDLDAPRVALIERGWADPEQKVEQVFVGDVPAALHALARACHGIQRSAWVDSVHRLSERVNAVIDGVLLEAGPATEPAFVRAALSAIDEGSVLLLGNSLPVRHVDRYGPAHARVIDVASQRGLSGIDGTLAQVAGLAAAGRPVLALIGDVTFAHDLGALTLLRKVSVPVQVVVLDNGGGRIFETLPIARRDLGASFDEMFLTAPALDIAGLSRAHGLVSREVDSADEIEAALASPSPGATVIRARCSGPSSVVLADRVRQALTRTP